MLSRLPIWGCIFYAKSCICYCLTPKIFSPRWPGYLIQHFIKVSSYEFYLSCKIFTYVYLVNSLIINAATSVSCCQTRPDDGCLLHGRLAGPSVCLPVRPSVCFDVCWIPLWSYVLHSNKWKTEPSPFLTWVFWTKGLFRRYKRGFQKGDG